MLNSGERNATAFNNAGSGGRPRASARQRFEHHGLLSARVGGSEQRDGRFRTSPAAEIIAIGLDPRDLSDALGDSRGFRWGYCSVSANVGIAVS